MSTDVSTSTRTDVSTSASTDVSTSAPTEHTTPPGSAFGLPDLLTDGRLAAACPTRTVLDHVTSTWGLLLLLALSDGPLRWGELRRTVEGISEKMLAQTLRTLVADGLVHREVGQTVPPRVDYSLTDLGRELVGHLLPLMAWISAHATQILTPQPPR